MNIVVGETSRYKTLNPDEPKKVTEHKDITDDGQTVTIKEVPEIPGWILSDCSLPASRRKVFWGRYQR